MIKAGDYVFVEIDDGSTQGPCYVESVADDGSFTVTIYGGKQFLCNVNAEVELGKPHPKESGIPGPYVHWTDGNL